MSIADIHQDPEMAAVLCDISAQLKRQSREDSETVLAAIFSMLNMGEYGQAAHYMGCTEEEAMAIYHAHFPDFDQQDDMPAAPVDPAVAAYEAERDAFIVAAGFSHGWENLESSARRMVEHALATRGVGPANAAPADAVLLDAARWNAFIRCKRIRMFGWAGVGFREDDKRQPGDNYVHFGGEFWTVYPVVTDPDTVERNAQVLTIFADAALAELANPTVLPAGA